MGNKAKTAAISVDLILLFVVSFTLMTRADDVFWVEFDVFLEHVGAGRVGEVRVNSNELAVTLWEGERFKTLGVVDDDRSHSEQGGLNWGEELRPMVTLLTWALPLILVLVFFVSSSRKLRASPATSSHSGGRPLVLLRRRARSRSPTSAVAPRPNKSSATSSTS